MLRKTLSAVSIALILLLTVAMPVFAIADPDSPPSVEQAYVYEDLLEDGDVGVIVRYLLDYAAIPTETATDAYLVSFVDTDGTTLLNTVAPYAYDSTDKGYGYGVAWLYFNATDVATYSLTSASEALYRIRISGNPTVSSGWSGSPPSIQSGLTDWITAGDPNVFFGLRVLDNAKYLETAWGVDLFQSTTQGNKLTSAGEEYFINAIDNLRNLAPSVFPSSSSGMTVEQLNYSTAFGATITNGTGTIAVSPLALTSGANTVNITGVGTFTLALTKGTSGTVASVGGGGTVTNSPVTIRAGTNTITTTTIGNITVTVALVNTQTGIDSTVVGTGFDLTDVATNFGMSRLMFSGLVWLALSIIICAEVYRRTGQHGGGAKNVMLVFNICIVGGALLGLLSIIVAALMFIGWMLLTAYVIWGRQANY